MRLKRKGSAAQRSRAALIPTADGPHDQRIHRRRVEPAQMIGIDIQFRNQALLVGCKLGNPHEDVREPIQVDGRPAAKSVE